MADSKKKFKKKFYNCITISKEKLYLGDNRRLERTDLWCPGAGSFLGPLRLGRLLGERWEGFLVGRKGFLILSSTGSCHSSCAHRKDIHHEATCGSVCILQAIESYVQILTTTLLWQKPTAVRIEGFLRKYSDWAHGRNPTLTRSPSVPLKEELTSSSQA